MPSPIERYLAELRYQLARDPRRAGRVVEEAADHLHELTAAAMEHGMSREQAESEAVHRFGAADRLARQVAPGPTPLRPLLGIAAAITILVALWLIGVSVTVLPLRDPAHVAMWRAIALGYLGYAALTFVYLWAGARSAVLRWSEWIISAMAVGGGAFLIANFLASSRAGRHNEGYLLLMGLLIAAHGLAALVDGGLGAAGGRRLPAG